MVYSGTPAGSQLAVSRSARICETGLLDKYRCYHLKKK